MKRLLKTENRAFLIHLTRHSVEVRVAALSKQADVSFANEVLHLLEWHCIDQVLPLTACITPQADFTACIPANICSAWYVHETFRPLYTCTCATMYLQLSVPSSAEIPLCFCRVMHSSRRTHQQGRLLRRPTPPIVRRSPSALALLPVAACWAGPFRSPERVHCTLCPRCRGQELASKKCWGK